MKYFLLICILIQYSTQSSAKLLDKIIGIVNENTITLSQVDRANKNLPIKKSVAPMIYEKNNYKVDEMLPLMIQKYIIRTKLAELNIQVSDSMVEEQINSNQKRLGVDRNSLLKFLKDQGSSYDEYFEALKEAIEFSYFINKVISPSIAISEQDVKNAYFKKNINDAKMNFKFNLIDYSTNLTNVSKDEFKNTIEQYRISNIFPEKFKETSIVALDDITEEGISTELNQLLKSTDENKLSKSILIKNQLHTFFVLKKELVDSENYTKQKESLKDSLYESALKNETKLWIEREKYKHYIKTFNSEALTK